MNSLATRLFAAFVAVILLVIVIISFALMVLLRHNPLVQRQGLNRLQTVSTAVAEQAGPAAGLSAREAAALAGEIAAAHHVRVLLVTKTGTVLADSAAVPINFQAAFRAARRDPAYPETLVGEVRDRRLQLWLFVARPAGGQRLLVVASPPERFAVLAFFRENLLWPLLEAGAIALVAAALLSILITRTVAQPLQRMAGVAQGIAHGRFEQAAPVAGPDEVRALGQAINSMAAQVQANQQAQRDFLANVSHELKTPLTSIQGFAQAVLDGAVTTPEGVQRSAQIIYTESDRLRRMVEGLLDLARLNPSLRALNRRPLDLRELLAAQVEKFGLRAREGGVALRADLPLALPAMVGDADRLAQVIGNLLDNALKHTPAGGAVTISAAAVPGGVEVAVADTGSGIAAADLPRIFERFYQVEKSRARAPGSGVGLGLAISQEIVEAHGGVLRVQSQVGHGSRFTVTLPVAGPDDTTVARKR
jgi:signal transduction histidine kinase